MITRWEYSTVSYGLREEMPDVLAKAGADGWELVTVGFETHTLVFKRPTAQ